MSERVDVVKRLFDAVRRRDRAALLEAYHPEVSIHEARSLPYGGRFHGHSGAVEHVEGFYRTWEGLKPPSLFEDIGTTRPRLFEFLEAAQDHVVVIGRQLAVGPDGSALDVPEAFVFTVQDKRVIESWMFNQDTVAILEFLRNAGR
ncbi:MAG TPA: nuclear transport factor 2 family protein [bacterium]|nr:nuclear transport factor 2 family protein [bacterium]